MNARLQDCKATLTLASPLIAAQLAQIGMEMVDTVMIGHISLQALASAALSGVTYVTVLVFFLGLLSAVGVTIARHLGAEEHAEVSHHLSQAFWLVGFSSIPAMLIIWWIPDFFLLLGQDALTVDLSKRYLHAVVLGMPATLLFMAMREFTSAMLHTKIVMWLSLLAIPINALLNYLFIYGIGIFPEMGIAGAGIATALINWLMFFGLFFYIRYKQDLVEYFRKIESKQLSLKTQRALIKIGWPIGVTFTFEVGLFSVTAMMMGYFGTNALAAHQVAMQSASCAFMVFFGLSQAAAVRVGRLIGAKQYSAAQMTAYNGIIMSAMVACCTAFCFFVFPYQIASIFFDVNKPESGPVLDYVVTFLRVAAVFQFFDSIQAVLGGTLRGLKDTLVPMFVGIFAYWMLGLSSGYYLAFNYGLGAPGLWWGLTAGLATSAVLFLMRFRWLMFQMSLGHSKGSNNLAA